MTQHSHRRAPPAIPPDRPPGLAAEVEHYTFGVSAIAAHRLALLAALFEPSSARLLRLLGYRQPRHAVDLGCGPGWSTRLVHALLGPASTLGLDLSAEYVAGAREAAPPGIEYRVHEVTSVPFPGPAPDFLYSRFLLTHLRQPEKTIETWGEGAADGAVLVLEETADLSCAHPAFVRYYDLVDELQAAYGQRLRIGATLATPPRSAWKSELDLRTRLSLPAARMARLHALNIASWRNDPYARASFDGAELDRLAAQLEAVANGADAAPPVRQVMRQLVVARR
jgi:trans-aconitate 2-methyltransferase